jgi:FixJ family two-component response regulator
MGSSKNIHVAVVDDDESACRSLSRMLRAAGFLAVTYPSAEAFLWERSQPQFDCLVLDIQLSGMSGLELQRRLSAAGDAIPIIFITGHDGPEIRAQAQTAGCAGYFRKTDPGEEILETIRRAVIRTAAQTNAPPGNTQQRKS